MPVNDCKSEDTAIRGDKDFTLDLHKPKALFAYIILINFMEKFILFICCKI